MNKNIIYWIIGIGIGTALIYFIYQSLTGYNKKPSPFIIPVNLDPKIDTSPQTTTQTDGIPQTNIIDTREGTDFKEELNFNIDFYNEVQEFNQTNSENLENGLGIVNPNMGTLIGFPYVPKDLTRASIDINIYMSEYDLTHRTEAQIQAYIDEITIKLNNKSYVSIEQLSALQPDDYITAISPVMIQIRYIPNPSIDPFGTIYQISKEGLRYQGTVGGGG